MIELDDFIKQIKHLKERTHETTVVKSRHELLLPAHGSFVPGDKNLLQFVHRACCINIPRSASHHSEQGNRRTSALWDSDSISSQKCARTESSFHVENICLADRTSMATWKCKLRTVLDLPFFNRIICKVPVGDNTKSLQAVIQTMLPKSLTTKTNKDIEIRLLVMISGIRKYRFSENQREIDIFKIRYTFFKMEIWSVFMYSKWFNFDSVNIPKLTQL